MSAAGSSSKANSSSCGVSKALACKKLRDKTVKLVHWLIANEKVVAQLAWRLGGPRGVYVGCSDFARLSMIEIIDEAKWFSSRLEYLLERLEPGVTRLSTAREVRVIAHLRRRLERPDQVPSIPIFLLNTHQLILERLKLELSRRKVDEAVLPTLRAFLAAQEERCRRMQKIVQAAELASKCSAPLDTLRSQVA